MSIRLSALRIGWRKVAMAGCALAVCAAPAADRGFSKRIEFSSPRDSEITTNLNQLSTSGSRRQLEEDLYPPRQSLTPQNSLEGVPAPFPRQPAPTAIQSKRIKELLERRKNWIFMRPQDLVGGPTVEEILKVPDFKTGGGEDTDLGPMGQFYQRLAARPSAAKHPGQSADDELFGPVRKLNSVNELGAQDNSDLPAGVKESAQALKSVFGSDGAGEAPARFGTRGSSSDPFGLNANTPSKAQVLEHKKYMDEYRALVESTWRPAVAPGTLNQPGGLPETHQFTKNPASGLASASSLASRRGLDAQMDVLNPMLGPPGLPDVNARAVGQTRPAFAPTTTEAPKVVAPTFAAPKRSF